MMPVASDSWWLWCFLLKLQQHSLLELSHISSWTWVIDIDCNMEPGYLVNPFNPHCVHFSTSKASCCFLCIIKQNKTWIIDVSHKVPILIERTHKLLTVSPSNNHPKLPWRAESSSVGCDANNHSQGLLYWPNWNILCQSGEQVLRGTMRQCGTTWLRCQWLLPPASLNILQI